MRERIHDWSGDEHVVELLTTELATNAIVHALSGFSVTVHVTSGAVRVEVDDTSPVIPVPIAAPPPDALNGRGLFLVASLSNRWGAEVVPGGKRVWFEVDA